MKKNILILVFLLLSIPIFNFAFNLVEDIPSTEKDKEFTYSDFEIASPLKKIQMIEKVFESKFILRNWLIQKYNYFVWFFLDSSPKRTVLKGIDDWIFIFLGKGLNGRDYSFDQLDFLQYSEGIQKIANICSKNQIQFYAAIVPEKFTIYPEKIKPNDLLSIKKDKYYKFADELKNKPLNVIFFHDLLLDKKETSDVYYKTDTHWNSVGGFVASNKILSIMATKFKEISPYREEEFSIQKLNTNGRDIGEYLSLSQYLNDTDYVYFPRFNESLRRKNLKILVIHDSYFYAMIDFFKYQFENVESWNFVQNENPVDFDKFLSQKPDIVLFILLERHIGNYDKRVFGHL
ncbi:alginate biosynthesis protein [Leptospira biflexa]|uniref:alginate O-acetyltransferase AlgX-related protein n=1 Tax=Leptospira biflexa TaxID=172 RepID=UPI001090E414|nr:alginate biosynthesis protein [Leptospira biflexa]TGM54005.1 alginate biosynthesis protein [Leptospira biflexa]